MRHERELWAAWLAGRWRNLPLLADGEPVQVVFRGRWSGGDGPDFRDAIIATAGGTLLRGDVELHLRASGWYQHGHDRNPAYNAVILHAVLDPDGPPTRRADGRTVPVLPLRPHLPAPGTPPTAARFFRASAEGGAAGELAATLDRLGELRFAARVARLAGDLATEPAGQVLWRAVLDALGYSRNRAPFRALADRLPWATLEAHLRPLPPDERLPEALAWLLAAGGLPAGEGWPSAGVPVAARRERLDRAIDPAPLPLQWATARVRPANQPRRRVLAAALLAAHASPRGLLDHLLAPFRGDGVPGARDLEPPLQHAAPAWTRAVAGESRPDGTGVVLGPDRAGEIAVNVLLPFAAAWADAFDVPELAGRALAAYRSYRPLAGNAVMRALARELALPPGRLGACLEQGLLQVDAWHRAGALDRLAEHGLLELVGGPVQLALFRG